MWKTITLAAVLSAASLNLASAQSVDPNGADRGYPWYAQAGASAYYNGQLQGSGANAPAAAPHSPGFQSRPARLQNNPAALAAPYQFPSAAPNWGGQQDEIGVDLQDRASSPYAGGTGG